MAISASGVHWSAQLFRPGRALLAYRQPFGEGNFQNRQPMQKAGAMQIEKRGLRGFDAPILPQVEVKVAAHGGLELVELEPGEFA